LRFQGKLRRGERPERFLRPKGVAKATIGKAEFNRRRV
jgi:hypothetical protein